MKEDEEMKDAFSAIADIDESEEKTSTDKEQNTSEKSKSTDTSTPEQKVNAAVKEVQPNKFE